MPCSPKLAVASGGLPARRYLSLRASTSQAAIQPPSARGVRSLLDAPRQMCYMSRAEDGVTLRGCQLPGWSIEFT